MTEKRRNSLCWKSAVAILVFLAGLLFILNLSKTYVPSTEVFSDARHVPHEVKRLRVNGYINAVAWNMDGSILAALSDFGGTITVWETKNWVVLKQFERYGGTYSHNSFSFLPDGSLLTAAPVGNYSPDPRYKSLQIFSLIQWNFEAGRPIRYFPALDYPPEDLSIKYTDTFAVSKDGALVAGIRLDKILLYDTHQGKLLREMEIPKLADHRDVTHSITFSPDGRELAVGTLFGMVHILGVDGQLHRSFDVYPNEDYNCSALAFNPDGRLIAVGKSKDSDGRLIQGKGFVYRESDPTSIKILQADSGKLIASLTGTTVKHRGADDALWVRALSWSPKGNILAAVDGHLFVLGWSMIHCKRRL